MCPRSHEQFEALRNKSRQAILSSALHLFARRGYSRATIDEIAQRAHISKGLIYNYFSSKEEILESLIIENLGKTFPMLAGQSEMVDPYVALEEAIHTWFHLIRSDADIIRLGFQLHTGGEFKKLALRKQEHLAQTFMRGLTGLFRRLGSPHPEMDTIILASIIDGVGLNYIAAPGLFPLDDVERHLVSMYCAPRRRRS
jgi:AcrR family transcriptional regulator